MKEYERNPFPMFGKWFWRDEQDETWGPYDFQIEALQAMINHITPWWQRCLDLIFQPFLRSAKKTGKKHGRECP